MTGPARHAGITLLEVMVAMTIGLALVLLMATLHARILYLGGEAGRTADAQDALRIALALLEYEVAHAGHWGPVDTAVQIAGRRSDAVPLAAPVAGDCGLRWAIDLDRPIEGWSSGWPLDCMPFGGAPATGGAFVLRRVEPWPQTPEANRLQVYADPWAGRLAFAGAAAAPGEQVHALVARAYYVSPRSTGDISRPSLRRKTLQRGPRIIDEEIMPGIADLQLWFGEDLDPPGAPGHGLPNRFVAPEATSGPVVAVRIRLVADDAARLSLVRTIALRNGPAP